MSVDRAKHSKIVIFIIKAEINVAAFSAFTWILMRAVDNNIYFCENFSTWVKF